MTKAASPEIAVMLSTGQHPISHRRRASHADRRAIGIAVGANCGPLIGVHAGRLDSEVAYDFFAAGLTSILVLEQADDRDPLPALVSWWRDRKPAVTFFGHRAEQGEGTGMLPYVFAEKLRLPLVSGVVSVARSGDCFEATQALSASVRRRIVAAPPFVAVSSARSPMPLRFSHAAARQQRSQLVSPRSADDVQTWAPVSIDSAVVRPMALRSDIGCTLEQRLSALMGGDRRVRQHYPDAAPEVAAQVILGALKSQGLLTIDRANAGTGVSGERRNGHVI